MHPRSTHWPDRADRAADQCRDERERANPLNFTPLQCGLRGMIDAVSRSWRSADAVRRRFRDGWQHGRIRRTRRMRHEHHEPPEDRLGRPSEKGKDVRARSRNRRPSVREPGGAGGRNQHRVRRHSRRHASIRGGPQCHSCQRNDSNEAALPVVRPAVTGGSDARPAKVNLQFTPSPGLRRSRSATSHRRATVPRRAAAGTTTTRALRRK